MKAIDLHIIIEFPPDFHVYGFINFSVRKIFYLNNRKVASYKLPSNISRNDSNNQEQEALSKLKLVFKESLLLGLGTVLKKIKEKVQIHTENYDDIIKLLARYHRIKQYYQKGLVDFQTFDHESIKIENAVMSIINNLQLSDLN